MLLGRICEGKGLVEVMAGETDYENRGEESMAEKEKESEQNTNKNGILHQNT